MCAVRRQRSPFYPPPNEVIIAPSILSADFSNLAQAVRKVERAKCPWLHLDIMDNHFVPNLTFGPPLVKALRKVTKKLFFDTHLMVEKPATLIDDFAAAGSNNLTVHEEACGDDLRGILRAIKATGMRCGVSIKPKTGVGAIEAVLGLIDVVLVMTVEPGFGGQELIPSCLNKVRQLRQIREKRKLKFLVEVDGGIHQQTAELAVAAGAQVLVAGSAIFNAGSVAGNVAALRKAAETDLV